MDKFVAPMPESRAYQLSNILR